MSELVYFFDELATDSAEEMRRVNREYDETNPQAVAVMINGQIHHRMPEPNECKYCLQNAAGRGRLVPEREDACAYHKDGAWQPRNRAERRAAEKKARTRR